MPAGTSNLRNWLTKRLLAAVVVLFAALPAGAETVPLADMIRGVRASPTQCAAALTAVWVRVSGRAFCIRYYLSTMGGEGARPVVFLQGDRLGRLNLRTGEFTPGPRDKDIDTGDLVRIADSLSRQNKTTAIYLARPGLDGSSGDHRIRHTLLELHVANAALDAIKRRHRFEGFHLIGQSGGSKLAGGMLALRTDIGCAAIGAGRLAAQWPARRSNDPAADYFDVADLVPEIAQRSSARILVVTDPEDKKVPARHQMAFVDLLRAAGGRAELFLVRASDESRHGVTVYSRLALAGCIRSATTGEIEARLQREIERRLAASPETDPVRGPAPTDGTERMRAQAEQPIQAVTQ